MPDRRPPDLPGPRRGGRRAAEAGGQPEPISAARVWRLQSRRSHPSVSLLLPTTPGRRLDADSRARLRSLRQRAEERLAHEPAAAAASISAIRQGLDRLVDQADRVVAGPALALFASADAAELVVLPVEVAERVVVDATFATRDLVRALHRTPRHLVLLLSARQARLLEGHAGTLKPAVNSKFPISADPSGQGDDTDAMLAAVDQALAAYRRAHPSPIILVGSEPVASAFRGMSHNLERLAGVVHGNHVRTSPARLRELTAPIIEDYLLSRQAEALTLLDRRGDEGRAVLGIDGCWLLARWGLPEMLAVEDDFFFPARLTADGDGVQAAEDIESPDVIDDLVDELIELVLLRGGWVALVESGSLPGRSRIALTQRSS